MKKLKFLTSLAFFAAVLFTSCGDVEPVDPAVLGAGGGGTGGGGTSTTGVFRANFDGQTFTASTTQAIVNDEYIAITGMKSSGEMFQITVPEGGEGTYTWSSFPSGTSGFALAYMPGSGSVPYLGARDNEGDFASFANYVDTAELVISDINTSNHTISGTFKFTGVRFTSSGTAVETKVFTNGSFSLSYAADVVAPTGNTFFAKLNGATYTATNITGFAMSNKISVIGRRGSVENISLSLPSNITPGTYELSSFGDYVGLYILNSTPEGSYGTDEGTVTIQSHNTSTKRIKGTFSFTADSFFSPNVYEITDGSFEVTYQ